MNAKILTILFGLLLLVAQGCKKKPGVEPIEPVKPCYDCAQLKKLEGDPGLLRIETRNTGEDLLAKDTTSTQWKRNYWVISQTSSINRDAITEEDVCFIKQAACKKEVQILTDRRVIIDEKRKIKYSFIDHGTQGFSIVAQSSVSGLDQLFWSLRYAPRQN